MLYGEVLHCFNPGTKPILFQGSRYGYSQLTYSDPMDTIFYTIEVEAYMHTFTEIQYYRPKP